MDMDQMSKGASWPDDDFVESSADPNISVSALAEEVPALTAATVVGVTLVVLAAIVVVFVLGVLIDCRQQRLIDKKMSEAKRRGQGRGNARRDDDRAAMADNMHEAGTSLPPAQLLGTVP